MRTVYTQYLRIDVKGLFNRAVELDVEEGKIQVKGCSHDIEIFLARKLIVKYNYELCKFEYYVKGKGETFNIAYENAMKRKMELERKFKEINDLL